MISPNIPYLLTLAVEKGVCNAIDTEPDHMEEQDRINHYTESVMNKLIECFTFVDAAYLDDDDDD